MEDLLISPHTREAIELFLHKPSHAVALIGPEGAGKQNLAELIAAAALTIDARALANYPYFAEIIAGGKAISIESIRNLKSITTLKTLGTGVIRRVVIIADAHMMTTEAQNALLKTLEEPPADTLLILTAIPDEGLLPTILSRLTVIRVELPNESSSLQYFSKQYNEGNIQKNYILSGGRPGMLASLLADNTEHPMVKAVADAKTLVAADPFTRMAKVNDLAKDKITVDLLLDALVLVYRSLLASAAHKNDRVRLKKFHATLSAINDLQELRVHNPTTKLVLTDLMWSL